LDFVFLCIRVPKSGSKSLNDALNAAFAGQQTFFLPSTDNWDRALSKFQHLRYQRAKWGALMDNYGDPRMSRAFDVINAKARPGDLISGRHFDYPFARQNLKLPGRIITMLRDPVARCISEYNYSREGFQKRLFFQRFDSGLKTKAAGRYNLLGYVDWLLEHREVYGNIASRFMGWDGAAPLKPYFAENVFHAGVLEDNTNFTAILSEKLGRPVNLPWKNLTKLREAEHADAQVRHRIEQIYPHDFELYEHVRAG
jgi:hypothetical protein